jgi:hypothetical protein
MFRGSETPVDPPVCGAPPNTWMMSRLRNDDRRPHFFWAHTLLPSHVP